MKKYKIFLILIALIGYLGGGCEKDITTEGRSRITHYVTFELEDVNDYGETMVEVGSSYSDPGFTAMEGEEDVTSEVKVEGSVDPNTVGAYHITYSAVNSDGYSASTSRTVIVYDSDYPSYDLTGAWNAEVIRNPGQESEGGPFNTTITIRTVARGFYRISDWLVGYYDQGYGYGSVYTGPGYFTINSSNEIGFVEGVVAPGAWGDPIDGVISGTYDPSEGTIEQKVSWLGGYYIFHETLNKTQ